MYICIYIYIYIYMFSNADNICNTYHIYYMVCDNRYKDVFYTITLK